MLNDAPLWVLILFAVGMWLIWAVTVALGRMQGAQSVITNRKAERVAASQGAEVDHAQPEAPQAHRAAAPAPVRQLWTPGHRRDEVAGRAPARRGTWRAADPRERGAEPQLLPLVQEEVQPVQWWEAGRRRDEREAAQRAARRGGHSAVVIAWLLLIVGSMSGRIGGLADDRHLTTDPACRHHRAPRLRSRLDLASRGVACVPCMRDRAFERPF